MDNLLAVVFTFSNVAFITDKPYYDEDDDEMNDKNTMNWLMRHNWKDMLDMTPDGVMVYDTENVCHMKVNDLPIPYIDYSIVKLPYSPN